MSTQPQPENTVAYGSALEKELEGLEVEEFDIRPDFVDSTKEPCFWILSKGLLRKRSALTTQPILRVGTERDVCDVVLNDPTCSPVQLVFIRLEHVWLICDVGRDASATFNGVNASQCVIGFEENCYIKVGKSDLVFNTVDRRAVARKHKAVPLQTDILPLTQDDGGMTKAEYLLRNETIAVGMDPSAVNLELSDNSSTTKGQGLLLGKHKICDIPLIGDHVSPAQAFVYWGDDGLYALHLGGQDETLLDGQGLRPKGGDKLENRAVLRAGENTVQIRSDGDVTARARELLTKRKGRQGFTFSPLAESAGEPIDLPSDEEPRMAGRDESVDLMIPDTFVSRNHFMVIPFAKRVMVKDNGSSNGTYVNGRPIEEAECMAGDIISAGRCTFLLHYMV